MKTINCMISPHELKVPDYIIRLLEEKNVEFVQVEKMEDVIGELDILLHDKSSKRKIL